MFCPGCGKGNPENQKFCSSCGLNLDTVSEALASVRPPSNAGAESPGSIGRHRGVWSNPAAYGILTLVLGLVITVYGRHELFDATVANIGTIVAAVGVFLTFLNGLLLVSSQFGPLSGQKPKASSGPPTTPILQLPPERVSVTESTTRQLDSEALEDIKGAIDAN
ncbi:MAG: zinc ribbon domain-containing protein [Blastocatellia bacterium]